MWLNELYQRWLGWTGRTRKQRRRQRRQIRVRTRPCLESLEDRTLLSAPVGPSWNPLGPAPIVNGQTPGGNPVSGRITGIAADPSNANTVYIATAGGGIWKTTDANDSTPVWTPLTDNLTDGSGNPLPEFMGAVAETDATSGTFSGNQIVYAGTGEANNAGDSFYGNGMLVSTNGGSTWTLTTGPSNAFTGETVSKIVIDPSDHTGGTAYAAMSEFGVNGTANGNTGIWKTTDFGAHWTNTTPASNGPFSFAANFDEWSDVVIDPHTPTTLYAAIGNYFGGFSNAPNDNGVYKSTDGGATWSKLNAAPGGTQDGRIALALYDDGTTNELVVSIANPTGGSNGGELKEMLKSTDGGSSFTNLNAPNYMGQNGFGQGWYDTTLAIDPSDPNYIYAGGSDNGGSPGNVNTLNGGTTWFTVTSTSNGVGPHGDDHATAFDANGNLLDGNDGGIFRLNNPTNAAAQAWSDLNTNLQITQFTGIAVAPTNPPKVYGGAQDNGTSESNGSLGWTLLQGGDGGITRVDPTNSSIVYQEFTSVSLQVSFNGGSTFTPITSGIAANTANFYVPYVLDSSGNIYYGTNFLNFSSNHGSSWSQIGTPGVNGFNPTDAAIDAVAVSPTNNNVVYVSVGGHLYVTQNAHSGSPTWTAINIPTSGAAGSARNSLAVDPSVSSGGTAYEVVNAFGGQSVWMTTDFGTQWTNITGNLPNTPVDSVTVSPDGKTVYIGTDIGVYSSTNVTSASPTWSVFGAGFPQAQVVELEYVPSLNALYAGTHGRGAWDISVVPTIIWTGADTNNPHDWNDPLNWNLDRTPQAGDNVIIPASSGSTFVNHASGTAVMASLTSELPIDLSGGTVETTKSGVTLNNGAALTITGGSVLSFNGGTQTLGTTTSSNPGSVVFGDGNGSNDLSLDGGVTLTNNLLIHGQTGDIGNSRVSGSGTRTLINDGTIEADNSTGTAGTLFLDPANGTTNNGTLKAASGATLRLDTGVTGGSITTDATAGSQVLQNAVTITGAQIGGEFVATRTGNNVLNADTIVSGGVLDLSSGGQDQVVNGLTLNGTVKIAGSGDLGFSGGTQTLAGTGSVLFADNNGSNGLSLDNGVTLTVGSGILIHGQNGQIGASVFSGSGTRTLVNQGTINADVAGGLLVLNPANGTTNTATLEATNGGELRLDTAVSSSSTAGTITTDSGKGSEVLQNVVSVQNQHIGGEFVAVRNGGNVLDGDTIVSGGVLDLSSGGQDQVVNGLTLNGLVKIAAAGALGFSGGTQTLGGTGSVLFADNNGSNDLSLDNGVTLTIGSGILIHGQNGQIGATVFNSSGTRTLVNQGTINADVAGGLLVLNSPNGTTNTATLEATNGGELRLDTGVSSSSTAGTITTTGSGSEVLQNGVSVQNQDIGGEFVATRTGANFLNADTIVSGGVLDLSSGGQDQVVNGLTLNGTVKIAGSGDLGFGASGFGPAQSLSGTGAVLFADNNGSNDLSLDNNVTLTIDTNILIHGQNGDIGNSVFDASGTRTLINKGTINADNATGTAGTLHLDPANGTTNNGTLEATNGATLQLDTNVTGGSITTDAVAGSRVLQNVDTVKGAQIGGEFVAVRNGGNVLDGDTIVSGGVLDLSSLAGQDQVVNGLTLNGVVKIAGSGDFVFNGGTQTLGGTGSVDFADNNGSNIMGLDNGVTLTVGSGILIHGQNGQIGASAFNGSGTRTLINQGTINADVAGGLLVLNSPNGTTNTATLEATNGGTLRLDTGVSSSSTAGTITTDTGNGSKVVQNVVSVQNQNISGEFVAVRNSGNEFNADTITSTGVLDLSSQAGQEQVVNGLTLNGIVKIAGSGDFVFNGGTQTLAGTGSVDFADNNGSNIMGLDNGVALTVGSGILIHGQTGQIGASVFNASGTRTLINDGTIEADVAGGTLSVNPANSFTNNGTIIAGTEAATTAVVNVTSAFTNFAFTTLTGGTYIVAGTFEFTGAHIETNAANVTLDGSAAKVLNTSGGANALASFLANASGADLTLLHGFQLTTAGTVSNQGTLEGTGTILGNLSNSGIVGPGLGAISGDTAAVGELAVTGNYSQASTGALDIKLAGSTTPGTDYDQLAVSGTVGLGGTLNVSLISPFQPASGNSFTIITSSPSGVSGDFATKNFPTLSAGLQMSEQLDLSDVKLLVNTTAVASVNSVSTTTNAGTYGPTAVIDIDVNFSANVTVTGTPTLALNDGATASYTSGTGTSTLLFTYTVSAGDTTNGHNLDYTGTGALSLSGGTIKDNNGNNANLTLPAPASTNDTFGTTGIIIDATTPIVTGVSTPTAAGIYGPSEVITIDVSFSEAVFASAATLALNDSENATLSGGSGTSTLIFTYTVAAGDTTHGANLDYTNTSALSGTIKNAGGVAADETLPTPASTKDTFGTTGIIIDATTAIVTSVSTTTAAGIYGPSAVITIDVNFSEDVFVTGTPTLALNDGATASYSTGSGSQTLVFTYTVAPGDTTHGANLDYTNTGALSGTIKNAGDVAADETLPAPASAKDTFGTTGIIIDATTATVTSVSTTTAAGTYGAGAVITIDVNFSEAVFASAATLALNDGENATLSGGSGTSTLIFTYTVAAGDTTNGANLDYASTNALSGTIKNAGGVAANETLPPLASTNDTFGTQGIIIDAVAPMVLHYYVLFGSQKYDLVGSNRFDLPWKITGIQVVFSKAIASGDVNSLTGLTTTGFSGLGTNTLTWNITPVTIGRFATALQGSGADALKDAAGNSLDAGAGFAQNFNVLEGDFNGDGVVNASDMVDVYNVVRSGGYNIFADINGDGAVTMADVLLVRQLIGTHL